MKRKMETGKKKLVIKIVAGALAVILAGTGIGFGAVWAKPNQNATASKTEETKDGKTKDSKTKDSKTKKNSTESESSTESKKDENQEDGDTSDTSSEEKQDLLTKVIKSQVGKEENDVGKEENVYVITDASGKKKEVIVSDWLKNSNGSKTIQDASNLKNIENVKGDETYTEGKNNTITWQADGQDIYYQGTTSKELPVDIKITYYLDGKEMKPADMAGKSGKVKIRFDYTNKEKQKVTVDKKEEEVYVPFTVMSAMILPTDTFAEVKVTNGKVMSEGQNNIVMGLAFPGLTQSLDLDAEKLKEKDIEIPDYVEVEAVTSDFSLDMTITAVLSDALSDIHLTDSIDLSEIDSDMNQLSDASTKLSNGTKALKDGVDTLSTKTGEFQTGAQKLNTGITEYTAGVSTLSDGINTLKSGSETLSSGAGELNNQVQGVSIPSVSLSQDQINAIKGQAGSSDEVTSGAQTMAGSIGSSISGSISADAVIQGLKDSGAYGQMESGYSLNDTQMNAVISAAVDAVKSGLGSVQSQQNLYNGCLQGLTDAAGNGAVAGATAVASEVNNSLSGFSTKIHDLKEGTQKLADGASSLDSGVAQLQTGAATLTANSAALVDGSASLVDGTTQLSSGVKELQTGATDLDSGMIQFDKDGIRKLTNSLQGEGKDVLDRLNATMDAGHAYHTFTELPEGVDGSVKFIIRTEAIK